MSVRSRRMDSVEAALTWSIPGGMLLVVAVAVFELIRDKLRRRTGARLSATYVDEVTAMFYGTKRMELDHRNSTSVMREEDAQGAPPPHRVDLDRGIVVMRPDEPGRPARP